MAEVTAIEWADSTFNPWMGCTAVSPACDFCYAEALMDHRYGKVQWGPHGERVRTAPANWQNPRRWQRQAAAFFAEHGRRRRVFCASLADVFDNKAPDGAREDLWQLILETPDLDWLLLTKRPQNIAKMLPAFWGEIRERIWLGISTENQTELLRRSQALRDVFAERFYPAVLFASAEPLLGSLDFTKSVIRFDWIIAGGESGPGARPTHPDWIRGIRDHCAATGTAFLFKQWGEWLPGENGPAGPDWPLDPRTREERMVARWQDGGRGPRDTPNPGKNYVTWEPDGTFHSGLRQPGSGYWTIHRWASRVGKKAAGRELDGITHDDFPEKQ